ncbi:MAG TPA: GAF domain-containing protein [Candidatus Binatia bacterium]|nr:GAF domain-containing protein [Candidatus Binatia bacterium]
MWWASVLRAAIAAASYGLGALLVVYSDAAFKLKASLGVGVGVFFAALLIEYRTTVRPALHVARVRHVILTQLSAKLLENLRARGLFVRMNLMVPCWSLRHVWPRRFFKIVWSVGMENQPDVNVRFPVGHGVAGECFQTKVPVFASRQDLERHRFPRRLQPAVRDLESICSYPVYEPPRGERQSGRVTGVLNLDAKTPGLLGSQEEPQVTVALDEKMRELAQIAGYLLP